MYAMQNQAQKPTDCLTGEVCIWWCLQRATNSGFSDTDSLERKIPYHLVYTLMLVWNTPVSRERRHKNYTHQGKIDLSERRKDAQIKKNRKIASAGMMGAIEVRRIWISSSRGKVTDRPNILYPYHERWWDCQTITSTYPKWGSTLVRNGRHCWSWHYDNKNNRWFGCVRTDNDLALALHKRFPPNHNCGRHDNFPF